jgi:protein-tyrosine phosphatase
MVPSRHDGAVDGAQGDNPRMPEALPRVLPLEGATNFRDLGGYLGHGGRPVRWRRLFRSDHLASLTPADRARLAEIGIARSFDFRGDAERAASPYAIDGLVHHPLAIEPTVVQRMGDLLAAGETMTPPVVGALMQELYRALVNDRSDRFAELFAALLETDAPVVFHCTAGKDRTGVAAALLLAALGVAREDIERDYLLTNEVYRRPPQPAASRVPEDALAVLWTVQPAFLQAAFDAIERDHGGIDRYLRRRIGLSDAALATLGARYLE